MFSFFGGMAQGAGKELESQDDKAFKLKLQNAQIEGQMESDRVKYERESRLDPSVTDAAGLYVGGETGRNMFKNAAVKDQPTIDALIRGKASKETAEARSSVSGKPMILGSMIMDNLPGGADLGLDPDKYYPYAMATFATQATRFGLGTPEMKSQLVGINTFDGGLKRLKGTYDKYKDGNPLMNTAEGKWAEIVKGWTSDSEKRSSVPGSMETSGQADELKANILKDADNAEIADMLIQRVELAMDYARATNGARPSDRDFDNAMKVIPSWTGDKKLRDLRFAHLDQAATTKREAIYKVGPKLREKQAEEAEAVSAEEKRAKKLAAAKAFQLKLHPPKKEAGN